MARLMRQTLSLLAAVTVGADMIDVLVPEMVPPAECPSGCLPVSLFPQLHLLPRHRCVLCVTIDDDSPYRVRAVGKSTCISVEEWGCS